MTGGKAIRLIIGACVLLLATSGCYRYHLLAPAPDPVAITCERTVHALAWGLITYDTSTTHCEGTEPGAVPSACRQSNAIDQVRVSSSFGFILATVLTAGFWSPIELKWHCAKPSEPPGEIGPTR